MKKHLPVFLLVAIILIASYVLGRPAKVSAPKTNQPARVIVQPVPKPATPFNKALYSTTDATSLWTITNKQHPLEPKDYTPANLVVPAIPLRANITSAEKFVRSDAAKALEKMVAAATADGVTLNLQSGYRSYAFQVTLYARYVQQQGQTVADSQSARPGYSEHQTGLAADLGGTSNPACNITQCYATTVEGKWLATNSNHFGFIIRYPATKQSITGYEYEPWHIRYVGTQLSQEMQAKSINTLEEFFNVTGGQIY